MSTDNIHDEAEAAVESLRALTTSADARIEEIDATLAGRRDDLRSVTRGATIAARHITDEVDELTHERAQLAPPREATGDTADTAQPATASGPPAGQPPTDHTRVLELPEPHPTPHRRHGFVSRPRSAWQWLVAMFMLIVGLLVAVFTYHSVFSDVDRTPHTSTVRGHSVVTYMGHGATYDLLVVIWFIALCVFFFYFGGRIGYWMDGEE